MAHAKVGRGVLDVAGAGLHARLVGRPGGATREGTVPANVVVEVREPVQLSLQLSEGRRRRLLAKELLHRLMESLDLPAGLGMVGAGVLGDHAEALELGLEARSSVATLRGVDRAVVREHAGRGAVAL